MYKSKSASHRVTELPNELTSELDECDPLGIVHLLRQSDSQLFSGWRDYESVYDTRILQKVDFLADCAASLIKENEHSKSTNVIVFSGCGTSGRIAWACSRSFNNLLQHFKMRNCFSYLIAGGDKALIVGDELPEDDPLRGAEDLADLTRAADKVLFIGITCGLSAPYVAGQIDYAMQQENFTTVLVGFNPVSQARQANIEKWDKTCRQTFLKLKELEQTSDRGVVLNPIVGPEPVTGSSRMKGGSMTYILLDTIFLLALSRASSVPLSELINTPASFIPSQSPSSGDTSPEKQDTCNGRASKEASSDDHQRHYQLSTGEGEVAALVDAFNMTYNAVYRPAPGIASLMSIAGNCLRDRGGRVFYVGADLFGIVGFIDSSEMVSTFGSTHEEVRGFVSGGWSVCKNRDGDLSAQGHLFCIAASDFKRDIVQTLTASDCVILLHDESSSLPDGSCDVGGSPTGSGTALREELLEGPAHCCLLTVAGVHSEVSHLLDQRYDSSVVVRIPYFNVAGKESIFGGFALKLILNVISTGANVLKGRVYGNFMINLTVANDKLFYRSVSIIAELGKVSQEDARIALLKAIYKDNSFQEYGALPVSDHIKAAAKQNMVVPLALVLASQKCKIIEAIDIISRTKSLRNLVEHSAS